MAVAICGCQYIPRTSPPVGERSDEVDPCVAIAADAAALTDLRKQALQSVCQHAGDERQFLDSIPQSCQRT